MGRLSTNIEPNLRYITQGFDTFFKWTNLLKKQKTLYYQSVAFVISDL